MSILIKSATISKGWKTLVNRVMENGVEIRDERGSLTKELLNTIVTIKNPLDTETPEGYFWSGEKLEKYAEQFLSNDKKGFIYTYGNRLRKHFENVDQIEEAIMRLKNFRGTRRAISITWDPLVDTKNEEVPCMILVDFKIRNEKLITTGLWRSHDIYGAWFPNAMGLANLAKHISDKINVQVGPLTIHSISAHIYEVNFNDTKNF
jgi:thymidylate synthase